MNKIIQKIIHKMSADPNVGLKELIAGDPGAGH